jgi:hypothetical protein
VLVLGEDTSSLITVPGLSVSMICAELVGGESTIEEDWGVAMDECDSRFKDWPR